MSLYTSSVFAKKEANLDSSNSSIVNKRRIGKQYTMPNDMRVLGAYQLFTKIGHWIDFQNIAKASGYDLILHAKTNKEIINLESDRLLRLGYTGNVGTKMYKSARYYFKNKSTKKKEAKKRTDINRSPHLSLRASGGKKSNKWSQRGGPLGLLFA